MQPTAFTEATTVDEVVRALPALGQVLASQGIDSGAGHRTLAEAAAEHRVSLNDLLRGLHAAAVVSRRDDAAAVASSQPGAAPRGAIVRGRPVMRSTRFFVASLLFALTFGAGLGACMLATITLPWNFLHGLSLAAVKTSHGYAQVFGFATLFIMGVAYHVIPRFKGTPPPSPALVLASFCLQVAGVLTVAGGGLLGPPIAWAAQLSGAIVVLSATLVFAWTMHRTLTVNGQRREAFEYCLDAGCAWLVVAAVLGLTAAAGLGASLRQVMWEAALWGFAGSWLFGMSLRILPVFMGVPPVRGGLALVIGYQLAVAAWVAVGLVETWTLIPTGRVIAGSGLALIAASFVLRLGVLGPRAESEADQGGYAKFIVSAYVWLLAAAAFTPAWSAGAALRGVGAPALVLDFGRHAFTLGFLTQMIIGVATRIVPVFTGAPLWSRATRDATFYLLNAAVAARALQVVVELAGAAAVWPYISLSGAFGLAAFVAFALNVTMTMRSRPAIATARNAGEPSPDDVVADLLNIPGALDLLVERGFRALQDPVMRAAMAGTVTLRQACRIHGVDLERVIVELRRLAAARGPA